MDQKRLEFASFYSAARDDCLRIVQVSVADRQLAEDLVAEAFTRAWMSWRKVSRHPAPRAWVVRTALNMHVSWWRRRRRETALGGHDVADAAGQDPGLNDELLAAVRRLPARQQELIILRIFFDLDTQATASALGIAPGTVGTHLHRALAALRGHIPSLSSQEAPE
jgi:RNA polymerase sigma-70 factor (sigma-E family)